MEPLKIRKAGTVSGNLSLETVPVIIKGVSCSAQSTRVQLCCVHEADTKELNTVMRLRRGLSPSAGAEQYQTVMKMEFIWGRSCCW
jgi:hypothetical protein